ncbi:hypothetical protein CWO04_23340 [Vibrio splendidus]|uniref:hypothetical protein n=1 Tax=Vibrio TaxID=662 RepID=UPI000D3D1F28|nr:hypothetical protein [Vibrio splendidus]PTP80240.1 hypothetical protein CWO04_23340 [Vibrio splendidus]
MIENLPEPDEFKSLSIQYLAQSIDHVFKTEQAISPAVIVTGFGDSDLEEEWESRQGVLGNSLIMLFLSIENYFKYEVSKLNPYELLTDESKVHIETPEIVDFEELYLEGSEILCAKYQKLTGETLDGNALKMLDELRVKRNKFTHGLHRDFIEPNYIVEVIAEFLTLIWGTSWISDFREVMVTEPLYGLFDEDEENMQLLQYFKFFEDYLSQRKFKKLIGMPNSGRRYLCPHCQENSIETGGLINANFACLEPNEPDAIELHCWLCDGYAEVNRTPCEHEECLGNVIYPEDSSMFHMTNICLTCSGEQGS